MSGADETETVVLSPEAWTVAREIQRLANLPSVEDAIRRALGDELFIQKKLKEHYSFIISKGDDFWELEWGSVE